MTRHAALLQVVVELDVALHDLVAAAALVSDTEAAVAAVAVGLLDELGLPGGVTAEVRASPVPLRADQPLRLHVDGRRCRYPDIVVRRVAEYHLGTALGPADDWRARVEVPGLVGVIAGVCRGALAARAGVLVGLPQVEAYREGLGQPGTPTDEVLLTVLREVLDLRVSLADRATVARILDEPHADAVALREALVTGLRPGVLEVAVHPEHLRRMTDDADDLRADDGLFAYLRRELFRELGLPLPALRVVRDDDLAHDAVRFRVNSLWTLPLVGVPEGRLLVNATADQLTYLSAAPATNPATRRPAALVDARHTEHLGTLGHATWTPLQFLVLALAAAVRRHAHCLVDTRVTDALAGRLEPVVPDLIRIAGMHLPASSRAALVRELVREKVSVRNLRGVLDVTVEAVHDVGRDDLAALTAAVRAALACQITGQHTQAGSTLVCYLIGADVEEVVGRASPDDEFDAVAAAIAAELSFLPDTASVPTILTAPAVRPGLAGLVGVEFPHMSVLSFDELADTVVVQPVARVSMASP